MSEVEARRVARQVTIAGVDVTIPRGLIAEIECNVGRVTMRPEPCDDQTKAAIELYLGMRILAPSARKISL